MKWTELSWASSKRIETCIFISLTYTGSTWLCYEWNDNWHSRGQFKILSSNFPNRYLPFIRWMISVCWLVSNVAKKNLLATIVHCTSYENVLLLNLCLPLFLIYLFDLPITIQFVFFFVLLQNTKLQSIVFIILYNCLMSITKFPKNQLTFFAFW